MSLYAGLMSGTSVGGVDAALVEIDDGAPTLLATHFQTIPGELRQGLCSTSAAWPI